MIGGQLSRTEHAVERYAWNAGLALQGQPTDQVIAIEEEDELCSMGGHAGEPPRPQKRARHGGAVDQLVPGEGPLP